MKQRSSYRNFYKFIRKKHSSKMLCFFSAIAKIEAVDIFIFFMIQYKAIIVKNIKQLFFRRLYMVWKKISVYIF